MALKLMELPFSKDALGPVISAETVEFHHGKHHQAYVDKTNGAIENTPLANKSLVEIIKESHGKQPGLFNNAAQVFNHDLYWQSIKPGGGGVPTGAVAAAIDKSFGNFETFKSKFSEAAANLFGSGWVWLVNDGGKLVIETTSNADTPLVHGKTPIFTMDVWEHAYYVDYRNARPKYIDGFWKLANWDQIAKNL